MDTATLAATDEPPINLIDVKNDRCPWQAYRRLHERGGVYLDPGTGHYVVVDFALIRKISADTARFSSKTGLSVVRETPAQAKIDAMYAEGAWPMIHTLLTNDPPEHRRFRALVDRVFTPARVASMTGYITELVNAQIDSFIDRGEVEFVADFAMTWPITIAGDFLGLPRADAGLVREFTEAANAIIEPEFDEAQEIASHTRMVEMLQYIAKAAERAVATSDGSFLNELMLIAGDGQPLTTAEFVWLVEPLLVGGHDSVGLALASGMARLIDEPAIEAALRADPALIANFVEEVLRTDSPIRALYRRTTTDLTLEGVDIPAGAIVQLQWAAANRDPDKFPDPDRFVVDRANARQHLGFGTGIHFCIGNQLARSELRIGFETLLQRMKHFRYADTGDAVEFRKHHVQWGPTRLHIRFDKA